MSRHRNVRALNYSDEYEGFDDVYGHSVEDDYSISPSDADFMYDRNNRSVPQMSAYLQGEREGRIDEEEEGEVVEDDVMLRPKLSELDEARLRSCLDEVRNVIGDALNESVVVREILTAGFDCPKALDALLTQAEAPKPQRARKQHATGEKEPSTFGRLELSDETGKGNQKGCSIKVIENFSEPVNHNVCIDQLKSNNENQSNPVTKFNKFSRIESDLRLAKIKIDEMKKNRTRDSVPFVNGLTSPQPSQSNYHSEFEKLRAHHLNASLPHCGVTKTANMEDGRINSLVDLRLQFKGPRGLPQDATECRQQISSLAELRERHLKAPSGPPLDSTDNSDQINLRAELHGRPLKVLRDITDNSQRISSLEELREQHLKARSGSPLDKSDISQRMSSLAELHERHLKVPRESPPYTIGNSQQISSLAELHERHLKASKGSPLDAIDTTQPISGLSSLHLSTPPDVQCDNSLTPYWPIQNSISHDGFSSLLDLKAKHSMSVSPEISSFTSLSDLASQHLTKFGSPKSLGRDGARCSSSLFDLKVNRDGKMSLSDLTLKHLNRFNSPHQASPPKHFQIPDLKKCKSMTTTLESAGDMSAWALDLSSALRSSLSDHTVPTRAERCVPVLSRTWVEQRDSPIAGPSLPCSFDASDVPLLKPTIKIRQLSCSPFGKTLGKKWRRVYSTYFPRQVPYAFTFDTPSPDDMIKKYLRRK